MAEAQAKPEATSPDVQRTLDFVHGALGASGHAVTDPVALELLERLARGEISGDECRAAMIDQALQS